MTTYYFPADHTADEWRQMAADASRRSQESWERSDTDGYLSQWASDTAASMYRKLAEVAENGNRACLPWLLDTDGRPIEDWAWVQTQYGDSIRVGRGDNVQWFNPSNHSKAVMRLRRDRAKGFMFSYVECEVVARFSNDLRPYPILERKRGAELTVLPDVVHNRYSENW